MAEASVSEVSCTISMTYADRDDLADKMVTPRHFQLFMKLLRRAGHEVRYLVVGEYGDLKDRAHFHAVLFFRRLVPLQYRNEKGKLITRGQTPRYVDDYLPGTLQSDWGPFSREIPQKRMVHIREWPHGHVTVDWNADEASIRYVCEYVLSDKKKNGWFSLSKKPVLGAEWFARKAALAKELQVLPSTFEYLPPGGNRDRSYLMTGATRRDYLAAITTDEADRPRMSEWVQKSFDKHQRQRLIKAFDAMPLEDQERAMLDLMEMKQRQKTTMMQGDKWRLDNYIEELLASAPDGIIYRDTKGDLSNGTSSEY